MTLASAARALLAALALGAALVPGGAFAADPLVSSFVDSPDPVARGGLVTYTATVENFDADDANGVVVTFPLPADTQFVSANDAAVPGACAHDGQSPGTVTCNYPTLRGTLAQPPGPVRTIQVVVRTQGALVATLSSAITVTSASADASPSNNTLTQNTTVNTGADLVASSLVASPAPATAGGLVTWTLSGSNLGPNAAATQTFVTTLPPTLAYVAAGSGGNGWSCSAAGQTVTCSRGASAPLGPLQPLAIVTRITGTTGGTVSINGTLGSSTADPDPSSNGANATVAVSSNADLVMSLAAPVPSPVPGGQTVTFALSPTNAGPDAADTGAQVTLPLPVDFGVSSVNAPSGWSCTWSGAPATVSCARSTAIPAGAIGTFTVVATTPTVTTVRAPSVTASIAINAGSTSDANLANNSASRTVTVMPEGTELSIAKTRTPAFAAPGTEVTSRIRVTNAGPRTAEAGRIRVVDTLDTARETFVRRDAASTNWSCTYAAPEVTCDHTPTLGIADAQDLLIVTQVLVAGPVSNSAVVSYSGTYPDPNLANNGAAAGSTVSPPSDSPDVSVSLAVQTPTGTPARVDATDAFVDYVATIANAASPAVAARDLVHTLTVPGRRSDTVVSVQSIAVGTANGSDAVFTCTGTGSGGTGTVTCRQTAGTFLNAGDTATITLRASRPLTATTADARATVGLDAQGDTAPSNNLSVVSVTIDPIADLEVLSVTPGGPSVRAGVPVNFATIVRNNGPSTAAGVTLAQSIVVPSGDAGFTFLAASAASGSCSGLTPGASYGPGTHVVTCTYAGTPAVGETRTASLDLRPNWQSGAATRSFDVIATVSGTHAQDSVGGAGAGVDTRTGSVTVNPALVDLLVNNDDAGFTTIGFDSATPTANDITYTVDTTNNGPSVATALSFTYRMRPPAGRIATFRGDGAAAGVAAANPSGTIPGSVCTNVGDTVTGPAELVVTCTPPDGALVASGATVRRFLVWRVGTAPASTGDTYETRAVATSNEEDSNTANNSEDETTSVRARVDLVIAKTPSADPVQLRQPFTWSIVLTNNGPGTSQATSVTDTLPAGMSANGTATFTTSVGGSGTCTFAGQTMTCTLGTLPAGASATIAVPVRMTAFPTSPSAGVARNCASAATSEVDPVGANSTNICADVGVRRGSIAGTVFQDRDRTGANAGRPQASAVEPRLSGVSFRLTGTDAYGNAVDTTVASDASGVFTFANLSPSDGAGYTIAQTQPSGFVNGPADPPAPGTGGTYARGGLAGASSWAGVVVPTGNATLTGYDFPEVARPTLSGRVYVDVDANGTFGGTDTGIAGATVRLLDAATSTLVTTATTDGTGAYAFTGLDPLVVYTIEQPLPSTPAGLANGPVNVGTVNGAACAGCVAQPDTPSAGTDRIANVDLSTGTNGAGFSFGERRVASIAGTVWVDANRDGVLDAGETQRLAGVTIALVQGASCAAGTTLATTTTAADGGWSFGPVTAFQAYRVCQTQPAGYGTGSANGSANSNEIAIASLSTAGSPNNRFGETTASVAGAVYLDANNDGTRQGGEAGLAGVTMTLAGTDALGVAVSRTATTDATGAFRFDGLLAAGASGYTVTQQAAQPVSGGTTTLNGRTASPVGTPTGVATVPSAVASIPVAAGAEVTGLAFAEILPVRLEGAVFVDLNGDGDRQLPGDVALPGVSIVVAGTDDLGAAVSRTLTTGSDGRFDAADLRPGTYSVTQPSQPAGTSNGLTGVGSSPAGGAAGIATAQSVLPSAVAGVVLTTPGAASTGIRFAEIANSSAIRGRVWLDADGDGTIDAGEPGIANVAIELAGTDTAGNAVSRATTTDATGAWSFAALPPGTYAVRQPTQPPGTVDGATLAPAGAAVTAIGTSPSRASNVALGVGQDLPGFAFGEIPAGTLSGRVFSDADDDGVVDAGEAGFAGQAIQLSGTDDLGATVARSAVTAADGTFAFADLRPGTYALTQPAQPGGTVNGRTVAGALGGAATAPATLPSSVGAIALPPGGQGTGYLFAEIGESPDLRVSKRAVQARFTTGNAGEWRISVRNAGQLPSSGEIVVSDRLPAGLSLAATPTGAGWSCTGAPGATAFECRSSAPIAAGAQLVDAISVTVAVAEAAGNAGTVDNAVMVEGGGEIVARRPTAAERAAFASNVAALPACTPAIAHDACRAPVAVQRSASVAGTVWLDAGGARGTLDGDDRRLPNWQVEVLRAADATIVGRATSGPDGAWRVADLLPGVPYEVRFRDPGSGAVFGMPVNGEAAPGSSGVACDEANALSQGRASSCVPADAVPRLKVVLAAGQTLAQQSLPVDPSGVVYDSGTRVPVPGATVTLRPDGACAGWSPAAHVVGATLGGFAIAGDAISMTVGADGLYQFFLAPAAPARCTFALSVAPPTGYRFPSAAIAPEADALSPPGAAGTVYAVQPQAGAPTGAPGVATRHFLRLAVGSATPGVIHNHLPVDPELPPGLGITKAGDRAVAEIGDTVRYTIVVQQTAGARARQVTVVDRLPAGFTYVRGTAVLDGVPVADPAGGVGPRLSFQLGPMDANGRRTLQYRVRVNVGAAQGDGTNRARAHACGAPEGCADAAGEPRPGALSSNEARHRVQVSGGVFAPEACLVGRVFVDCNGNHVMDAEELGVPGVRLVTSEGTQFLTDSEGKYSFCGLPPRGTVLRVDPTTLPAGSRLVTSSNRNLGDPGSLWLDLKNGELHRGDFVEGSCRPQVTHEVQRRRAQGEIRAPGLPLTPMPAAPAPGGVPGAMPGLPPGAPPPGAASSPGVPAAQPVQPGRRFTSRGAQEARDAR